MNLIKYTMKTGLRFGLACSFVLASFPALAANNVLSPSVAGSTDPVTIRKAFKLEHDPLTNLITAEGTSAKTVLKALAQKVNLNLAYLAEASEDADEDEGSDISLPAIEMRNVPVSEAFAFILKLTGLVGRRMYSTIVIATPERISSLGLDASVIKTYKIYNQAASVAVGAPVTAGGGGTIQNHLETLFKMRNIQPIPKMIMDGRTSTLIVMGSQEAIDIADKLVPILDKPLPQVMVEIKLIELSKQGSQELGVQYGFSQGKYGAGFNNKVGAGGAAGGATGPNALKTNGGVLGNPDTGSGLGISFNSLAEFTPNFNAKINALIQNSQAKILTNPRMAIQHGVQATFDSTTKIPVISTTATATATVQTVQSIDIGEKVVITPFIDPEKGFITMKIAPDISTRGQSVSAGEQAVPERNTRKVTTTLRVKDGDSIIIGGMMRKSKTQSKSKLPFLGDLPLFGSLFSATTTSEEETELIIIVTPRIMKVG